MDLTQALSDWRSRGFAVLPGYLPGDVLAPPLAELELMFPSAEGFHGGRDPRRGRFVGDEFAGIDSFPCASTKISLLAMHDCLVHLARTLLRSDDLRIYTAEAWAKYTGANDYDQELHRDYLNHTLVVPPCGTEQQQVEMFVYLVDVPDDLGRPTWCRPSTLRIFPPSPTGTRARSRPVQATLTPVRRRDLWLRPDRNSTSERCPLRVPPAPWWPSNSAPSTGAPP